MHTSRNKSKYTGIKRFLYSAKYALDGLYYAYRNEKSLWIHGVLSIVGIILGIVLKISPIQWSIILISLGIILAFELVNTAMEACVDMVTTEYNELAKIAKDCCSAATFVTSIMGAIISGVIFIPKVIELINML
jgi:diacylglycerol kinase